MLKQLIGTINERQMTKERLVATENKKILIRK